MATAKTMTAFLRLTTCALSGMFCLYTAHGQTPAPAKPEPPFPFVLPWDDSTPSVVDLSSLLPKPAGKFGHVHAGPDGHLYVGDDRIRFFGVDLAFSANIPTHEEAEKIAARMAKFGINIVRFHIMDMRHFPDGILARNEGSTRNLDPEALDRLDYFTSQLNSHGIYVNLCLLNYRPINSADGLPKEIDDAGGDPFQRRHVVGFWDQQVLDLQKEYARKLLTHRNAYTQQTYAESPAVAFVEINNENGLLHAWLSNEVDGLPGIFRAELGKQWNQWLRDRYGSTEKLRQAWADGERPAGTEELTNRDFTQQLEGWTLETHSPAEATVTPAPADAMPDGLAGKSAQIAVTKPGTQDWHVRFQQHGVRVEADRGCNLSFWARADKPIAVHVSIDQTHEPYHALSGRAAVRLTTAWQQYKLKLPISETDDKARIVFDPPMEAGNMWVTGVSLQPGAVTGLAQGEQLGDGSIPPFTRGQFGGRTSQVQQDWIRFLWETEDHYWQAMYRYLKDDLKVQSPVIGTVVGCSTPNMMAKMDAVDSHAYWQHPVFPGRPWDAENWYVQNVSMVNDRGGILPGLALRRVLGKPFCVTEYGNAAPNTHAAEGHLLRAAYAALQDWDYISASRYSHQANWDLKRIRNFFDIDQHPTKMATMIPAAAMYLRGDVQPAKERVVATIDKERELAILRRGSPWDLVNASHAGVVPEATLVHRVAIATEGQSASAGALSPEQTKVTGNQFTADTGQLDWDLRQSGRGVVTVDTPKSKAVIGFGGGKRFDLAGVVIEPGPTMQEGWSVITVTAMAGDFAKPPCRVLITATGDAENTNMGWRNPQKSSVGKNWGEAPSLVEGIPARVTLPIPAKSVSAWSLDERGQRKSPLPAQASADGNAAIVIGPQWQTIWYEVEVK